MNVDLRQIFGGNGDEDYDWREAFGCAGDPDGEYNSADVRSAPPASKVSLAPFGRKDVAELFAIREGVHDEANWLAFGRLTDGRFFFLSAGCDYTGWDCQSGGMAFVADNKDDLIRFGMDEDERSLMGAVTGSPVPDAAVAEAIEKPDA